MKEKLKGILELLAVIIFVVVIYIFVQINLNALVDFIKDYKILGAIVFVLFSILVVVILPQTSLPIIPLVSHIYGWQIAGLLNLTGIFIGCLVVFYICRGWGKGLVKRFISLEKIEKKVKEDTKFFSLVLLRMIVPAEILSYALGLFTNVSWKVYFWTSFIGLIPFSFLIAYIGVLPWFYQVVPFLFVLAILLIKKIWKKFN